MMLWEEGYPLLTKKEQQIEAFLNDVDEQISYHPIHTAINEELRAHIDDKAEMYMEFGLNEEISYEKAIRDMGDASALGTQFNETHKLRTAKPMLILVIILAVLGMFRNIASDGIMGVFDSSYYMIGFCVLGIVFYRGYPFLLRYADNILKTLLGFMIFWVCWQMVRRFFNISLNYYSISRLFSPSVLFGIFQLSTPALAVFLYRRRRAPWRGLGIMFLYQAATILVSKIVYAGEYSYIPFLIMVISTIFVTGYMIVKRYLNIAIIKGFAALLAGTLLLLGVFGASQWNDVSKNIYMFVNPDKQASVTNAWDDSYNNVLIRELLSKAEPIGEIKLSKEDLVRYGTAQWYYEDGKGIWNHNTTPGRELKRHISYRMQYLDNPEIEDVMPQHHHNNYRIAFWILKYGWIPGLAMLSFIVATQLVIFMTAWKIHNRLGRVVAVAGSMTLAVQNIFYILGNFGFQFGDFGNLPFVSEGLVSIVGTMIIAGLILSAYRYDTVIKEDINK